MVRTIKFFTLQIACIGIILSAAEPPTKKEIVPAAAAAGAASDSPGNSDIKLLIDNKLPGVFSIIAAYLRYQKEDSCSLRFDSPAPTLGALSSDAMQFYCINSSGGPLHRLNFGSRQCTVETVCPLNDSHRFLGLWVTDNNMVVLHHSLPRDTAGVLHGWAASSGLCSFDPEKKGAIISMVDVIAAKKDSVRVMGNEVVVRLQRSDKDEIAFYSPTLYTSRKLTLPLAHLSDDSPHYVGKSYVCLQDVHGISYLYDLKSKNNNAVCTFPRDLSRARKIIPFPNHQFAMTSQRDRSAVTFFDTHRQLQRINFPDEHTNDILKMSKNRCLVTTKQGHLECLTLKNAKITGNRFRVNTGPFSMSRKDKNHVWTCSNFGHIKLWHARTGNNILSLNHHVRPVELSQSRIRNVHGGYAIESAEGIDYYPEKSALETAYHASMPTRVKTLPADK